MKKQASYSSALSRLFSAGVFHELSRKGASPLFARLIDQVSFDLSDAGTFTVADAFERAFSYLRQSGLRNEYVYRVALVRNILLGTHSLNTASMLTEFRAEQSKADLVILNGTATVYEIKSERDTLARLEKQVNDYQKVFAKIYVIAGNDHVHEIAKMVPDTVGVMQLKRWNRIGTVREAKDCSSGTNPTSILDSIRSIEAIAILKHLEHPIPDVPNTQLRSALAEIFASLEPVLAHRAMVQALKSSRDLSLLTDFISRVPLSLQAAALTYKIRAGDTNRLLLALDTPIATARAWT